MIDHFGNEWTVEQRGTVYLLTRPGAMMWATQSDLDCGLVSQDAHKREPRWNEGLEYRPEQKAWVKPGRVAA